MSRKRTLIALSILVLCVIAFMITTEKKSNWLPFGDSNGSTAQEFPDPSAREQARSKRRIKTDSVEQTKPTHSYDELKDFIIPELRLENITFKQALYELKKQYYEICQQTGETPISFRFKVQGESNRPIQFTLRNLSFISMLKTLAAIEGMQMEQNGRDVAFAAIQDSGKVQTRLTPITPMMMQKLSIASSKLGMKLNSLSKVHYSSAIFNFQHDLYRQSFTSTLSKLLDLPESSITLNKYTSQLSITADSSQASRIDALLTNYLAKPELQVKIKSQIIKVSADAEFDPATISDPGFFRNLASTQGIDILTSPTIVARSGETATISMTQEFTYRSESGDHIKDSTGLTVKHQTGFAGFGLAAGTNFDHGYKTNDSENPVKHIRTTFLEYTQRSTPSIIRLNTHDGSESYLILTHEEIDATGKIVTRSR